LWSGKNIHEVAEAVHDESYPGYHQQKLLEWLWVDGVMIDFRCHSDLIDNQIHLADLNTWVIRNVSPAYFYIKWQAGCPHP
jgi:hypothetical protein